LQHLICPIIVFYSLKIKRSETTREYMTRDSIIARPIIIGVTTLPEAPGFLAIPFNADAIPNP
jgi:hypothetical protein